MTSQVRAWLWLLPCCCAALSCKPPLRTDTLVGVFNGGVIDTSNGDPFRTDAERRADIVTRAMKQELIDGFFAQGSDHGLHYAVSDWMGHAGDDIEGFYALLVAWSCDRRVRIGEACPAVAPSEAPVTADQTAVMSVPPSLARSRRYTHEAAERWSGGPTTEPLCTSSGRDPATLRRFVDAVRFEAALDRALPIVGELLIERLVDKEAVLRGGRRAFYEAAAYLRSRAWHRQLDVLTTGLVVKGGASTGIYSAGVVWVALRLIDRCARDPDCRRGQDLRLALLSGTSTGALIAAAVDMFNTGDPWRDHQRELDDLAYWFTCKSTPDLYCVQSRSAFSLVEDQRGLVRFDGIEDLLSQNLQCDELLNRSELIANSVDFRTGALYAFSDQDPSEMRSPRDVIDGVLASALLPFVGNPVDTLPWTRGGGSRPDPLDAKQRSAYLDGGVRSELPVLPIARRGAERVLVVSSAASVLGETGPLEDAADILVRYIDVSTGGVTESELGHAQRWVESTRLREIDLCKERAKAGACGDGCDEAELCEAHFSRVCAADRAVEEEVAPKPAYESGIEPSERATDRLHRFWRMTSFFRDELSVAPSRGYAFERGPHRSLFHAGAEAARVRCLELALTLGVIPRDRKLDPALRRKLVDWCSEPLPSEAALCHGEPAGEKPLACADPPYGARRVSPSSEALCRGSEP